MKTKQVFSIEIGPGEWEFEFTAYATALDANGIVHRAQGNGDTGSDAIQAAIALLKTAVGSDWAPPTGNEELDFKQFCDALEAVADLNKPAPRKRRRT